MKINTSDTSVMNVSYWMHNHFDTLFMHGFSLYRGVPERRTNSTKLIKTMNTMLSYGLTHEDNKELGKYIKSRLTKTQLQNLSLNNYRLLFSNYMKAKRSKTNLTTALDKYFLDMITPNTNINIIITKDKAEQFKRFFDFYTLTKKLPDVNSTVDNYYESVHTKESLNDKIYHQYNVMSSNVYKEISRYLYINSDNTIKTASETSMQLTDLLTMTQGIDVNTVDLSYLDDISQSVMQYWFSYLYSSEYNKEQLKLLTRYCILAMYLEFIKTTDYALATKMNLNLDDEYIINACPDNLQFVKDFANNEDYADELFACDYLNDLSKGFSTAVNEITFDKWSTLSRDARPNKNSTVPAESVLANFKESIEETEPVFEKHKTSTNKEINYDDSVIGTEDIISMLAK